MLGVEAHIAWISKVRNASVVARNDDDDVGLGLVGGNR